MTYAEYVASCLNRPFEWGVHDCVIFVATWVKHVTGVNYFEGLEAWSDALSAVRVVEEGGGLEKLVTDRLQVKIPVNYANDGDVVLIEPRTLGLMVDGRVAVPGPNGLEFYKRRDAKCAWAY